MKLAWFRVYHEARNDAKLRSLTDAQHRLWFNLLCLASEQAERGTIVVDDYDLLSLEVAGGDDALLQATLDRLVKLRIVEVDDDIIYFINFLNRQYDKPSDMPEATRDRKRKERDRKAQDNDVTPLSHPVTPVTPRGRREEGEEKKEEREERPPPTALVAVPKPTGRKTPYPEGFEVRDEMFNKVRQKHPDLDIDAATEKWANSMRANTEKYRYTNWEAAWYNAMDNAVEWRDEKKEKGGYTDANGHKLNNRSQATLRQRDNIIGPRNSPERPRDGLRLVTGQDTV